MPDKPAGTDFETVTAPSRAAWRAWLAENHASSPGVWLILHKKNSTEPSVAYADAVEEALCFGWIDSLTKTLDATRYRQVYTPRKPKSVWSPSNKERVSRLIEQGLMTPPGLAAIEIAKANGAWTSYDTVAEMTVSDDLAAALRVNPAADQHWQSFNASSKKGILYWIASAKRPETRARRIARTVELAAQGIRVMFDQP